MADVEAAGAAPPTQALPPPAQAPPMMRAAVAVVLRGILTLAARGLLCGFIGAMWVSNAANIVRVVVRRFGGEGSARAAAVAGDVFFVSAIAMILLFPSAVMLLGLCLQCPQAEAGERERRHRQDCGHGTPTVLIFVLFSMNMLIGLAVLEGASGKWASSKEMVAYGFRLCDYGSVGCSAMVCFIFIPTLIAQLSALLR